MDKTYFDKVINRGKDSGSHSIKWENYEDVYKGYDIVPARSIPMWVADMDFLAPQEVIDAVVARGQHGIYGYSDGFAEEELKEAAIGWYERRHHVTLKREWMFFAPGIIPAINLAVQEFTEEGDGVIIQPPVYYPFRQTIENNNRITVNNKLLEKDGVYSIDFEGLKALASEPKNKMLILSNPHNPVGRVWSAEELKEIRTICKENNVLIFADEIHCDLMLKGSKFLSMVDCFEEGDQMIFAHAPSKTFNLAGVQVSLISVPDETLRRRMKDRYRINALPSENVFSIVAGIAAYQKGDSYGDALVEYIGENIDYAIDYAEKKIPGLKIIRPAGTYLVWMDFRNMGKTNEEVIRCLLEKARVIGDPGDWFGPGGEGHMRFNFACPKSRIIEAMERIQKAFVS